MTVRALDLNGDFTWGMGKNNYLQNNAAVAQAIRCNLLAFLNDCFFDMVNGVDWFNLLGGKSEAAIQLAVSGAILNTPNVTGIKMVQTDLSSSRRITISYQVQTVYSVLTGSTQFDLIQ